MSQKIFSSVLKSTLGLSVLLVLLFGNSIQVAAANCDKLKEQEVAIAVNINGKLTNCVPKGNAKDVSTNPIYTLLLIALRFLSIGVGIAVVGGIVWGGIMYGTARGNASQAQEGISVITNSAIGLLLFIFMFALLNFLIPGGIFT